MKRYAWVVRCLGLLLFAGLLWYARPASVWAAAREVDGGALGLAVLAAVGVMLLRNARWKQVLAYCGGTIRWRDLLPLACVSSFLGNVTPGRAGELWKMSFAGAETYTRSQYLVSFFYDRLFDVATMAALAFVGLTWSAERGSLLFRIALMALMVAAVACVLWRRRVRGWIERAMRRYEIDWRDVRRPRASLWRHGVPLLIAHGLSVVLYVAIYGFLFRAVGVSVPAVPLAVAAAISAMVSVLPVSVAGLGTREAVLLHFLRPYYDAPSQVILVGMLDVVLLAYVLTGLLALPCWLMGLPKAGVASGAPTNRSTKHSSAESLDAGN